MKDSFKDIMKKVELKKAPDGFAERLMLRVESEASPIKTPQTSNDLLSKRQKIFLLLLVSASLLSIYFFLTYKNNPESMTEEPFQSLNFLQLISEKLALMIYSSDLIIYISTITFVIISYFLLDMTIRKGLKLSY